jgi:hypothetical protein
MVEKRCLASKDINLKKQQSAFRQITDSFLPQNRSAIITIYLSCDFDNTLVLKKINAFYQKWPFMKLRTRLVI